MKVMSVFGTRPEAVKMAPLVKEIQKREELESIVCLTGQHRELLLDVLAVFHVSPDYNLDIMREKQTLSSITGAILAALGPVLDREAPDIVLVHGDTTTSFAAALTAFYRKIPVGHVEAGLRTGNRYAPYPEEMNRLLTDRISTLYFAPTNENADRLWEEGIRNNIFVTGNTVIDAFAYTIKERYRFHNKQLREITKGNEKIIVVTAHRRENLGEPLREICLAVKKAAGKYKTARFIYPVHPNPQVRETAEKILSGIPNIYLVQPLDLTDMHNLLKRSYLLLTDSGGLQEEAPSLHVPVLVLRKETERGEAVAAGCVRLAGTGTDNILKELSILMEGGVRYEQMKCAVNPYGDGKASGRIVERLLEWRENSGRIRR